MKGPGSVRMAAVVLATLALSAVCADEYELPKPAPLPALKPAVPDGEELFYEGEHALIPGVRMWSMGCKGDMGAYGTTQSVGDGAGLMIHVPAGGETNAMCSYDTGLQKPDPKVSARSILNYKGLCFWFKGDGSDATAIIATGYAGTTQPLLSIPMKTTEWRKVFIPWEDWGGTKVEGFWFLTFRMERTDKSKANWYVVDRVCMYKGEPKTEEIKPTPDTDPPGMLPAKAFLCGRQNIAKTLAKLKEKKPVKIVVAGDSIPCGAQLWYAGDNALDLIYWRVLARRLKEVYGYADAAVVMRTPAKQTPAEEKQGRLQWVEDPATRPPASDLAVVGVLMGGRMAANGLEHMDQVLAEKPDLVLWEYGANDATFGSREKFTHATAEAMGKLTAAGIDVVLQTITPTPGIAPVNWMANKSHSQRVAELNQEVRRIATEKKLALADMEQAFACRGMLYVGSLYADNVHPNHLGHEMMADVLDALLTDRDIRIWKRGPAADNAKADTRPTGQ